MNFQLFLTRAAKLAQVARSPRLLQALLFYRVLAGVEHKRVFSAGFQTLVDIGANRGQFSLAARRWAPLARIVSFEPISQAAAVFRKVFQADSKVTLHKAAIGPDPGEATIHVAGEEDSSSLLPISSVQERLFPGTGEVRTETVRVGRLAEFISAEEIVPPALLKLDVQGYELEALRGCEDLLGHFSQVYVECSFMELYSGQALADEVIAYLHEHGFGLQGIYNMAYDTKGRAIQGDFLFAKK